MRIAPLVPIVGFALAMSTSPDAQSGASAEVTFAKDIAPILQRSCQHCHNASGVAPMPLTTYEEVRPWSRAIKTRTGLGARAGVMPPWFVEKNIGIQKFKDDPSLERRGDRQDRAGGSTTERRAATPPTCRRRAISRTRDKWTIGEPDLVAAIAGNRRAGDRSRQVGLARDGADRAHRGSLRVGASKFAKSTTFRRAGRPIPSAAATSGIT